MRELHQFVWGFLGSLAVEIVDANEFFQANEIKLPERYKLLTYWLLRLGLALIGGILAVASSAQTPYTCLGLGAAAPLIIRALRARDGPGSAGSGGSGNGGDNGSTANVARIYANRTRCTPHVSDQRLKRPAA